MSAPQLMFWLGAAAILVAVVQGAALVSFERDLLGGDLPTAIRVRRQLGRFGNRQQQNRNQNDQRSGQGRQPADDASDADDSNEGLFSWSRPSANRNQQPAERSRQAANTGNRNWGSDSDRRQQDRDDQDDDWLFGQGGQGGLNRRTWGSGSGVDVNRFGGNNGGGGLFGGGLFGGNRPSIIGGLIRSIGQGVASTVQGVTSALANKWNTKIQAVRGLASSIFNTGREAARSGLQAGMAHPRFALDAVENVF